jgi:hypothetical protein
MQTSFAANKMQHAARLQHAAAAPQLMRPPTHQRALCATISAYVRSIEKGDDLAKNQLCHVKRASVRAKASAKDPRVRVNRTSSCTIRCHCRCCFDFWLPMPPLLPQLHESLPPWPCNRLCVLRPQWHHASARHPTKAMHTEARTALLRALYPLR